MVRVKKRYFVVQLELESEIIAGNRRKNGSGNEFDVKQYQCGNLAEKLKSIIEDLFGDHGRASVSLGLRIVYANEVTRLVIIGVRHGPHKFVAAAIPFLKELDGKVKVIPRLIYTGATIRHCYKEMEKFQRRELDSLLEDLNTSKSSDEKVAKMREVLREKLMSLKPM